MVATLHCRTNPFRVIRNARTAPDCSAGSIAHRAMMATPSPVFDHFQNRFSEGHERCFRRFHARRVEDLRKHVTEAAFGLVHDDVFAAEAGGIDPGAN